MLSLNVVKFIWLKNNAGFIDFKSKSLSDDFQILKEFRDHEIVIERKELS